MTPKHIEEASKIYELNLVLENISSDDNRELSSYTIPEVVDEAKYVLSNFFEDGHMLNAWRIGEDGDKSEAAKEISALRRYIKKYA